MQKDELFSFWSPTGAFWTDWVKPVLFAAYAGQSVEPLPVPEIDTSWALPADGSTALVVDLPGALGVSMGLALQLEGYRPIPLYNAVLAPRGVIAAVDVMPILAALVRGVDQLRDNPLPANAPPAFLLDAGRRYGFASPIAPAFDNRSVSFPTDFPSALMLQSHGIRRVLLIQQTSREPQADLAHTLRLWQKGGIGIQSIALSTGEPAAPLVVRKPTLYGWIAYRISMLLNLRSAPLGGFGGMLSESSSGG